MQLYKLLQKKYGRERQFRRNFPDKFEIHFSERNKLASRESGLDAYFRALMYHPIISRSVEFRAFLEFDRGMAQVHHARAHTHTHTHTHARRTAPRAST